MRAHKRYLRILGMPGLTVLCKTNPLLLTLWKWEDDGHCSERCTFLKPRRNLVIETLTGDLYVTFLFNYQLHVAKHKHGNFFQT